MQHEAGTPKLNHTGRRSGTVGAHRALIPGTDVPAQWVTESRAYIGERRKVIPLELNDIFVFEKAKRECS